MADASETRRKLRSHAGRIASRAARNVERELVREASVGSGFGVSGETAQSIRVRATVRSPTLIRHRAEATAPQAEFRERGTRPHEIRPRRAQALRFFWPRVGRVVMFAKVNHPGNPPMPWFGPIVKRWPRALREAARGVR